MMRRQFISLLAVLTCGCAGPQVHDYLDNDTAAAISVAERGYIFARQRPDLAVHAQDYVTVTPVQVNRSGERIVYLYCHLWSTIDRRGDKSIVPVGAELALIADDRRIVLPKNATDLRRLGFGHAPVQLPNRSAETRVLAVDSDVLRFIVNASQIRIALTSDGFTEHFLLWQDGRAGAQAFLDRIATKQ